jgi:hypothetical protein
MLHAEWAALLRQSNEKPYRDNAAGLSCSNTKQSDDSFSGGIQLS